MLHSSPRAALPALLLLVCLSLLPGRPALAVPLDPGPLVGVFKALPLPEAMGGGDREALRPRNDGGDSPGESMLRGSFLGSLLLGTPFEGLGTADIVALVLLGLFLARLVGPRRRSDRSRFEPPESSPDEPLSGDRDGNDGRFDRQPPQDRAGPNTPEDNAWTRKLDGRSPFGPAGPSGPGASDRPRPVRPATVRENAAAMWGALSGAQPAPEQGPPGVVLPPGFDLRDFLEGARTLYVKLQKAWAARELGSLAPFTTGEMMDLLQKQAAKNPEPGQVAILRVEASLEDFRQEGGEDHARVLFHATMRLDGGERNEELSEHWRFVRGARSNGSWQLAGIDAA